MWQLLSDGQTWFRKYPSGWSVKLTGMPSMFIKTSESWVGGWSVRAFASSGEVVDVSGNYDSDADLQTMKEAIDFDYDQAAEVELEAAIKTYTKQEVHLLIQDLIARLEGASIDYTALRNAGETVVRLGDTAITFRARPNRVTCILTLDVAERSCEFTCRPWELELMLSTFVQALTVQV